jgi:hypothetical protein
MIENKFQDGVRDDIFDSRDYQYADYMVAKGISAYSWELPWDIEKILGWKLSVKNQNGSYSCGGQAIGAYGQAREGLINGEQQERSAKFIYAQCYMPDGGSRARDLIKIASKQGFGLEEDCSSYENGNPPTEAFMTRSEDITDAARTNAKKDIVLDYYAVNPDIDSIATAVFHNGGCFIVLSGQNGKGWLTEFPQPPEKREWGHFVYVGKTRMFNGHKQIGILNSWGKECGNQGWQWLDEDYFKALNGNAIYGAWTIVVGKKQAYWDKIKEILTNLLKFIKK